VQIHPGPLWVGLVLELANPGKALSTRSSGPYRCAREVPQVRVCKIRALSTMRYARFIQKLKNQTVRKCAQWQRRQTVRKSDIACRSGHAEASTHVSSVRQEQPTDPPLGGPVCGPSLPDAIR